MLEIRGAQLIRFSGVLAASFVVCVPPVAVEGVMQFLERVFGFAPDGGSGSLEVFLVMLLLALAALALNHKWFFRCFSADRSRVTAASRAIEASGSDSAFISHTS